MYKRIAVGIILLVSFIAGAKAQSAPVRGEVSAGVYENIKSDGAQALKVAISASTTWTQTTPTVTNASAELLAVNTSRKTLLIQNNHATGIVYINFAGAATTSHLQIGPGQSLFITSQVTTQQIRAIGSVASNTAVVVIEGI